MTRGVPALPALVGLALVAALCPTAAKALEGAAPPWLHFDQAPSLSVDPGSLRLDPDREQVVSGAGHGVVDLLRRHEFDWHDDGTQSVRTTIVRRFLSDEGVRSEGTLQVRVRSRIEQLHVEEAWLALPDGRRRPLTLESVQVVDDGSSSMFSDDVTVFFPFEGLAPGATAVLVTRVTERASDWPFPASKIRWARGWSFIERLEVDVCWDEGLAPRQLRTDSDALKCDTGPRGIRCRATAVPPIEAPHEATIWLDVLPQVVVGEPHTWAELAAAGRALVEDSADRGAGLRGEAPRIMDGADSERQRLERIHRFVADEIRYVALEHGVSAVVPAPADRTFEVRYGDCKGKVALFLAMARHAGLEAHAVLVSTQRNGLDKLLLPSWLYFDHMIACARLDGEDGEVCLDLTSPDAATGVLPPWLYSSVALDLLPGVEAPRAIPSPEIGWDIESISTNEIDCRGDLVETTRRTHRRGAAVSARSALRPLNAEGLQRRGIEAYRAVLGDETEPEVAYEGVSDPATPLVARTRTVYPGILESGTSEYREQDVWLRHYASWFGTANEVHPAWIPGARIHSRMTYTFCPGTRVRFLGASLDFASEFGSLKRSYRRAANGGVSVETEFRLVPRRLAGDDLGRFRRHMDAVLAQLEVWFQFEGDGS